MKKYIKYIVPSMISFIILSILFYVNGLYPYGSNSIVQVDADYQFIPVLYRIYDFLHGNGSIIYNDMGLGNNIYISMILQGSIYSPVNLLLYFTKRGNIVNYFNVILLVKICLISLTSYIYINYKYKKVDYFYKILGSVVYSFCGFVIFNYFNIMWLDGVILLPIIMIGLDKLINDKGYLIYIISLSMCLMISYYISYFILVFIIFYTYLYINLYKNTLDRKKIIYRLGISTVISILIASISLLPGVYQMFISSRFGTDNGFSLMSETMAKSLYILFSPLLLILFILFVSKYKENMREVYFYLVLFVLFGLGIFIEPINLAIHGGSYWDFPYRYGFITSFIILNGGMYFLDRYDILNKKKYDIVKCMVIVILLGGLFYISKRYLGSIIKTRIFLDFEDINVYIKIIIILLIIYIIYIISMTIGNEYIKRVMLGLITVLGIYIISSFTMFYNDGYYLSKKINDINNAMDISDDGRYKMGYSSYTTDYGFIINTPTLDNWIHLIPQSEIDVYHRLGYLVEGTSVKSYGGTIFSDWLLNFRYIISDIRLDDRVYQLVSYSSEGYIYRYRYNENVGMVIDREIDNNYEGNGMEYQNEIYKSLFDRGDNIIDINSYNLDEVNYIDINIDKLGLLYIEIDDYESVNYIEVNDRYIYNVKDNIILLGVFDNDTRIYIDKKNDNEVDTLVGYVEYDKISILDSRVRYVDNKYYVDNVEKDSRLILPINNIDGIKVYLNDRLVKSDDYLDNFIVIDLDNGDNVISIKYEMPLFRLGIIFSILGIILLILYKYIGYNKILMDIGYYLYLGITYGLFVYYYLYSMVRGLLL